MTVKYAFLTSEYPTTSQNTGGLATYVYRMSRLMAQSGISVTVFVLNDIRADIYLDGRVSVHHILRPKDSLLIRLCLKVVAKSRLCFFLFYYRYLRDSSCAANYIRSLSSESRFDVIQYSDYLGIGRCLSRLHGCRLVVRCSSAIELYMKADGRIDSKSLAHAKAEVDSIKNADIIISPSELVANFYENTLCRPVTVVRPPAYLEVAPKEYSLDWLPDAYLLHYAGWLHERKGTKALLAALEIALQMRRSIKLVLIGNMTSAISAEYSRLFALYPNCLLTLPPMEKSILYGVIQNARAVILPSLVDNIPNTLIESLLLGANVIISKGSSLDEVVRSYRRSAVVDPAITSEFASELVRAWDCSLQEQHGFIPWIDTAEGTAFEPRNALQSHLRSVKLI